MYIGLLMSSGEADVADVVIPSHRQRCDVIYSLGDLDPGLDPDTHTYDYELPLSYGRKPRDWWRQWLYQRAVIDHGYDHWFLLLHGDEVWTFDPRDVVARYPRAEGFVFHLPLHFPREPWDDTKPVLDQLRWALRPGWPEFRMYHGAPHVAYVPGQHFDTRPCGIRRTALVPGCEIQHYLYRAPDHQRARARHHQATGFDPDNYLHITHDDAVLWTDAMIASYQAKPWFKELHYDD